MDVPRMPDLRKSSLSSAWRWSVCLSASSLFLSCAGRTEKPAVLSPLDDLPVGQMMESGRFEKELWRLDLSRVTSSPTQDRCIQVVGDTILVQDQAAVVHAIDADQGMHRWMVQTPGALTQAVVRGDDGFCFVHEDQMVVVRADIGSRMSSTLETHLDSLPFCSAVDSGGTVYFGDGAPSGIQSVSPESGLSGWHYDTSDHPRQLFAFQNGATDTVIGVTGDGLVFSLDAWPANGNRPRAENWWKRLPVTRFDADGTLWEGKLYLPASGGFLYCFDAASGRVDWRTPLEGTATGSAPVLAEGSVYVASSAGVEALDAKSGASQWTASGARRAITRIGDRVYTEEPDGSCGVRGASDGVGFARFSLDGYPHVPSVQGGGRLVLGTGNGQLMSVR